MASSSSSRASRWSSPGGIQYEQPSLSFRHPRSFPGAVAVHRRSDFNDDARYTGREDQRLRPSGSMKLVARSLISCFIPEFRRTQRRAPLGLADHIPAQHDHGHNQRTAQQDLSAVGRESSPRGGGHKVSACDWQVRACNDIVGSSRFSYSQIAAATGNFSLKNQIGKGGFGVVYKGVLKDGTVVAVKRGKKGGREQHLSAEFTSEIKTLSSVDHLNLVSFFGCMESRTEWILILEYVANGNLREHLDGRSGGEVLELAARLDIAIDVAHAISYLHTYADQTMIHRDIKSSNILLTERLRAKVTDFGFARFTSDDPTKTHVSTQIKGTAGYLDPEYVKTYQLTQKSDVFSFGVVLVEIVTGRRPIERNRSHEERRTVRWAMRKLQDGEAFSAMDPVLMKNTASIVAVEKVLELAYKCVMAERRELRPSMAECAEILWKIRKSYRESLQTDADQGRHYQARHFAAPTTGRHTQST